jgi:hypothetical protein
MARSSGEPGPALNQAAFVVRVMPASVNEKPLFAPPYTPPNARFMTRIWSAI